MPEQWIALVYVIVSAVLILAYLLGLVVGTGFEGFEKSEFAFIDSLRLKWFVGGGDRIRDKDMGDIFGSVDIDDTTEV